jgi:hypothetical protein
MPRYRAQDITITAGTAIAHLTSGTLDHNCSLVETTGAGETGRTREPGFEDWTLGGGSRFNGDKLAPKTEVSVSMAISPPAGGSVAIFTGTGIINQFQVNGDIPGDGAVDVTFQITRSKD